MGQVVVLIVGVGTMALGVWLLVRRQPPGAAETSEAKSPLVSFSGPPGLIMALAGLALVAFPFTPWWPAELDAGASASATPTASEPAVSVTPNPTPTPTPTPSPSEEASTATADGGQFEAENGALTASFEVFEDGKASGGEYIAATEGRVGSASFEVEVQGGTYFVWGRVRQPATVTAEDANESNNFFVLVDGSNAFVDGSDVKAGNVWDFHDGEDVIYRQWEWDQVSLRCRGTVRVHTCDPLQLRLDPGTHTIELQAREPDSQIDAIIVTPDPAFEPRGTLQHGGS